MNNYYQESTVRIRFVYRSYIFISILQQCAAADRAAIIRPQFWGGKGRPQSCGRPKNSRSFSAHQALSTMSDAFAPFAVPAASMYWGD